MTIDDKSGTLIPILVFISVIVIDIEKSRLLSLFS